jgi:hypothetical protein
VHDTLLHVAFQYLVQIDLFAALADDLIGDFPQQTGYALVSVVVVRHAPRE